MKAIHNKDYSVVKTFKAGKLAFFDYSNLNPHYSGITNHLQKYSAIQRLR